MYSNLWRIHIATLLPYLGMFSNCIAHPGAATNSLNFNYFSNACISHVVTWSHSRHRWLDLHAKRMHRDDDISKCHVNRSNTMCCAYWPFSRSVRHCVMSSSPCIRFVYKSNHHYYHIMAFLKSYILATVLVQSLIIFSQHFGGSLWTKTMIACFHQNAFCKLNPNIVRTIWNLTFLNNLVKFDPSSSLNVRIEKVNIKLISPIL